MLNMKRVIIASLSVLGTSVWSTQLTFEALPLNVPASDMTADGVTVSFEGLITIAEHSSEYGFGGKAGDNTVIAENPANFGGRFLVNEGFVKAEHCPTNFYRAIRFDPPVRDVSMHIADIDAGEGLTLEALDITNNVLRSLKYPAATAADSKLTHVEFSNLSCISTIRITGDDPVGIDNLSFASSASNAEEK